MISRLLLHVAEEKLEELVSTIPLRRAIVSATSPVPLRTERSSVTADSRRQGDVSLDVLGEPVMDLIESERVTRGCVDAITAIPARVPGFYPPSQTISTEDGDLPGGLRTQPAEPAGHSRNALKKTFAPAADWTYPYIDRSSSSGPDHPNRRLAYVDRREIQMDVGRRENAAHPGVTSEPDC
jgi:hypothetical protein